MKIALSAALAALALLTLLQGARADQIWTPNGYSLGGVPPGTVVGSATSLGGGLYRYDYTITNIRSAPNVTLDDFTLLPQLKQASDAVTSGSQVPYPPSLNFPMSNIQTSPSFPFSHVDPSGGGMVWFGYAPMGGGLKSGQSGQVSFVVPFPPGVTYYMLTSTYDDPDGGSVGGNVDTVIGPDVSGGVAAVNTPEPATGLLLALGGLAWAAAPGGVRLFFRKNR